MTVTTKRSLIALLLSLVLVVSLFTVCVSATDAATDSETVTEATTETETETSTSASGTTTETATETSTEAATGFDGWWKSLDLDQQNTAKSLLINGIIIAVIIVILVLVAVKFRKKLSGFLRSVKSELKKIVWSSKENTRKSFLVVAVVAVLVALVIFIIDLAFNTGIDMLGDLFDLLKQPEK